MKPVPSVVYGSQCIEQSSHNYIIEWQINYVCHVVCHSEDVDTVEPSFYPFWAACVVGAVLHISAVVHALLPGFPGSILGSIVSTPLPLPSQFSKRAPRCPMFVFVRVTVWCICIFDRECYRSRDMYSTLTNAIRQVFCQQCT